jgi:hypothetical protein
MPRPKGTGATASMDAERIPPTLVALRLMVMSADKQVGLPEAPDTCPPAPGTTEPPATNCAAVPCTA